MSKSNAIEDDTLAYWLTVDTMTITRPTTWFLALYKTDPMDDNSGIEISVADDTAYARQAIAFDPPITDSGLVFNNADITYPATVLAVGSYTMTHFAIFDAVTAGNMLYHGTFGVSKTINGGETITFAAGGITVTED
ncbi:MAG: hypothetical protein DRQ40_03575 [Gammaproteobacteria bacterium]|nr:MAG: hypothetical protein DRQ40_03575 [Gammaproteobacteria bacterium]